MSDTHERPILYNDIEQAQPYAGMEQFRDFEIERRRFRKNSRVKVAIGLTGVLGTLILSPEGIQGVRKSRPLPPPPTHRASRDGRSVDSGLDKPAKRQLLEVIERHTEITPARAALETSLSRTAPDRPGVPVIRSRLPYLVLP